MSYKEQSKQEGAVLTRIKLIKAVLSGLSQITVAAHWQCNKNTVGSIMSRYQALSAHQKKILEQPSLTSADLAEFSELKHASRAPLSHCRSLAIADETVILDIHEDITFGPKRMYTHLKRQGNDMAVYTLAKIKGCYKRNELLVKKIRTGTGERRALYDYAKIAAFEHLHYDVKHITDQHALPKYLFIISVTAKIRTPVWSFDD